MHSRSTVVIGILLFIVASLAVFLVTRAVSSQLKVEPVATSSLQQTCSEAVCKIQLNKNTYTSAGLATFAADNHRSVAKEKKISVQNQESEENRLITLSQDNWLYFGAGIWLFGLLLAFTPCVLPLLILISGFLGQGNEISYARSIFLALTYVMALSVTFAVIGILAGTFGIYISAYFQNPWLLAAFSIILAVLALALLGFYSIRLPRVVQAIAARHNKLQSNYQFIEIAVMGTFAALIASPCIAAPLIGVLSYIGKSGDILLGAYGLFLFGLGIGAPLVFATVLGKALLPQQGYWQHIIKFIFGVLMLGVAIWISSRIIPASYCMLLWSILMIFTASYMFSMTKDQVLTSYTLLWNTFGVIVFAYGLMIFTGYMVGNKSPLNPLVINQMMVVKPITFSQITSIYSLNHALANAKKLNKPVVIFFSADWCSECQDLKSKLSNDSQTQELLSQFILLEVNLSKPDSAELVIARQYHISGTPEIVFVYASGVLAGEQINGNISLRELIAILERISEFDN